MSAEHPKSKLPHSLPTAQAFSTGLDAARSVLDIGTTATAAKPLSNPEWSSKKEWTADLEHVWRRRTEPELQRLHERARRMRQLAAAAERIGESDLLRVQLLKSAAWAESRARAVALSRTDVVNTCRKRWRKVACHCTRYELQVGCDAPTLCGWCRRKHWRKWRHRITRSMADHLKAARRSWRGGGMPPGIYLLTLTGPHSGDIAADRERLGEAWKKLRNIATRRGWWTTFALTWEVTRGDDGLGHVHAHVALISSWVPYTELHEAWRECLPGARVLDVQAPNRKRNQAGSAAEYLAKYVTKGVDPAEMSGGKAGEMLVAFRNKRKVTTSRHFWSRKSERCCSKCHHAHRLTEAPQGLQDIAPDAVLRSQCVRYKWRDWVQDTFSQEWQGPRSSPPSKPRRERANKLNAPSKWVLSVARVNATK